MHGPVYEIVNDEEDSNMKPLSHTATVQALTRAEAETHGRFNVNHRKRVCFLRYLYSLAHKQIANSEILDLGCGAGVECIAAALMGAKRAVGIDIDESGLGQMSMILSYLRSSGIKPPVESIEQNLMRGIPFSDNSFDIVLLIEAVSHIVELERVLKEALRATKPGGVIVVKDINNLLTIGKWRGHVALWDKWENGPIPGNEDSADCDRSYKSMRRCIIANAYPDLIEEQLEELSAATTGTYGAGIREVVDTYLASGQMPDNRYERGTCPVSPDGRYMERLFDPHELARLLEDIGASRAVVMPYLTHGNWYRALINKLFGLLPREIALRLSHGFIVIAYK